MTAYTEEMMTIPALLETDVEAQAEVCPRIGQAFTEGRHVRLTSPRGTDLTFSIERQTANVLTNIPSPGELAPVPDIEVNVVPATGTASGRVDFDASVPYLEIGVLAEPIVCEVAGGVITSIEGGAQACAEVEALRSYDDPDTASSSGTPDVSGTPSFSDTPKPSIE